MLFGTYVHLSGCPPHAWIVSKRLKISPKFFHYLISPSFWFFVTKGCCVNLTASPLNKRGSDFQPICGYISETVIDRGILSMEDEYKFVFAISNSAAFDDLEWPRTPVSRSQHSLNANISQTVNPIHSMFGSSPRFSGSADRMVLFPVRQNPRWRPTVILDIQKWPWNLFLFFRKIAGTILQEFFSTANLPNNCEFAYNDAFTRLLEHL